MKGCKVFIVCRANVLLKLDIGLLYTPGSISIRKSFNKDAFPVVKSNVFYRQWHIFSRLSIVVWRSNRFFFGNYNHHFVHNQHLPDVLCVLYIILAHLSRRLRGELLVYQ